MSENSNPYREKLLTINISRRSLLGGTTGMAAAALLAACGGGDDDDDATATPDAAAGEATPAGTEPPPADEPTPTAEERETESTDLVPTLENPEPGTPSGSRPDELVIAWGAYQLQDYGLDPLRHSARVAESQLRHIYEPLVRFENDFSTIVPALATEWEIVDDLTWQFKLREGVKFHNGEDFNAEAVRFSIMRPLSDETPGDLRGSRYGTIEDVEVVDEFTVNIKTRHPDPVLLGRLAAGFHTNIIAPQWAADGGQETISREAVGTGPYKLVSWSPEEDLVVEANEDYWDGAPEIKKVRMVTISEAATRVAALRSGEVHVANPIPPEELEGINESGRARVLRQIANRSAFYWITVDVEPFNDVRVRQAINYAANVDGVIETILLGDAVRLATTIPPYAFGFNPSIEPYPNDPERAKELLAEAGYPDGIDLQIWYRQGRIPKDKEVAEAMCLEMGKGNIRCTPELREAGVLTELQRSNETPGLVFSSWGNAFADAEDSLTPLFGCAEAEARGDWTRPYGCNEEFEEVLQAARQELDVETRRELLGQAQQILYDDAAALFQYLTVDLYGINNWVLFDPRPDQMVWAHMMRWNE